MVTLRSAAVFVNVDCDDDGRVLCSILRYHWVGHETFVFVCHRGVGYGIIVLGLLGDDDGGIFCGVLHCHWVEARTVEFVRYCIFGSIAVVLGLSVCRVFFFTSVWIDGH